MQSSLVCDTHQISLKITVLVHVLMRLSDIINLHLQTQFSFCLYSLT